jgi:hypothetical protein
MHHAQLTWPAPGRFRRTIAAQILEEPPPVRFMMLAARIWAFCASAGRWRAWRPARHSRSTAAGARGNPGRTRREDPPPLVADLDCAVRGSDPLLRVCLEPSRRDQSTPPREHAPRTNVRGHRTFGPAAQAGRRTSLVRLRHAPWPAPSAVLIFAVNGLRCRPAEMAGHLGAGRGSVTGIYLPGRIARNLPAIHAPLLLVAAFLHGRNIRLTAMCANAGPA